MAKQTSEQIEPTFLGAPLSALREAASALLSYAVGPVGRATTDPIYRLIVEGRIAPKYSSCGDLAHWLLYRLGVRAPWINRAEFKPPLGHGWRVEWNLTYLTAPTNPAAYAARKMTAVPQLLAGDVFQVSNRFGGHELCVTAGEPGADPGTWLVHTAEYGQPGGAPKSHVLSLHAATGLVFCGSDQITHVLPLAAALALDGLERPDLVLLDTAIKATLGAKLAPAIASPAP